MLNKLAGDIFIAESAGLEPGILNPIAVEVLKDEGIDVSGYQPRSIEDVLKSNRAYDYVVTVCDEASAEKCPTFPSPAIRLHWGFPDPSAFKGTFEEKLAETAKIKNLIKEKIQHFCSNFRSS